MLLILAALEARALFARWFMNWKKKRGIMGLWGHELEKLGIMGLLGLENWKKWGITGLWDRGRKNGKL